MGIKEKVIKKNKVENNGKKWNNDNIKKTLNQRAKEIIAQNKTNREKSFGTVSKIPMVLAKESFKLDCGDFEISLSALAYAQVIGYLTSTACEVSCFGLVKRKNNTFYIRELFVPKQEGSGAETNIDNAALAQLVNQLIKDGRADDVDDLKVWLHSHPNLGVFFSKTDTDDAIDMLCRDWWLSIVVNEKLEMKARLDIAVPLKLGIEGIPIYLENNTNLDIAEKCRKELEDKVSIADKFVVLGNTRYSPHMGYSGVENYWDKDNDKDKFGAWVRDPDTGEWRKEKDIESELEVIEDRNIPISESDLCNGDLGLPINYEEKTKPIGGVVRNTVIRATEEIYTYDDGDGMIVLDDNSYVYLDRPWFIKYAQWRNLGNHQKKDYRDFFNEMIEIAKDRVDIPPSPMK